MLVQLLVGVLYLVAGFMIFDMPVRAALVIDDVHRRVVHRRRCVSHAGRNDDSLPTLGLGAVQRHRDVPARCHHLPPIPAKRHLGDRAVDRHGNAVQRLDLDHVVVGHPQNPGKEPQPDETSGEPFSRRAYTPRDAAGFGQKARRTSSPAKQRRNVVVATRHSSRYTPAYLRKSSPMAFSRSVWAAFVASRSAAAAGGS